jgi:hypothetical protein
MVGNRKQVQYEPQRALVLIGCGGLEGGFDVGASHDPGNFAAAIHNIHVQRFVEDNDENAVGERR